MLTQANKWQAQLIDGTKFTGGSGDPLDVNVGVILPPLIKSFAVSSSSADSIALYIMNGREYWSKGGKLFQPAYPLEFQLVDTSILTIERGSTAVGDLIFTQV